MEGLLSTGPTAAVVDLVFSLNNTRMDAQILAPGQSQISDLIF